MIDIIATVENGASWYSKFFCSISKRKNIFVLFCFNMSNTCSQKENIKKKMWRLQFFVLNTKFWSLHLFKSRSDFFFFSKHSTWRNKIKKKNESVFTRKTMRKKIEYKQPKITKKHTLNLEFQSFFFYWWLEARMVWFYSFPCLWTQTIKLIELNKNASLI